MLYKATDVLEKYIIVGFDKTLMNRNELISKVNALHYSDTYLFSLQYEEMASRAQNTGKKFYIFFYIH